MNRVAYMSHPIGERDMVQRGDTLADAGEWLKFLVDHTRWAILTPWLAYITHLNDLYSARALTDQIMLLERCDVVVQVGGFVSPHMTIEENHARRNDIPIVNLTAFGARPGSREDVRRAIAASLKLQHEQIRSAPRRRVWLPPLSAEEIADLRSAVALLSANPFAADAQVIVERILTAALRRPSG